MGKLNSDFVQPHLLLEALEPLRVVDALVLSVEAHKVVAHFRKSKTLKKPGKVSGFFCGVTWTGLLRTLDDAQQINGVKLHLSSAAGTLISTLVREMQNLSLRHHDKYGPLLIQECQHLVQPPPCTRPRAS
jgi:hypothetical protein